jgi:hypothetical protein
MNALDFLNFFNDSVKEEIKIFTLKGNEYSGEVNRFANFERLSDELGLHPIEIAWVYAAKHKDSVTSFIKEKKVFSNEDIYGRISDLRNYLILIGGMIIKYRNLPESHKWHIKEFTNE